MQRNSRVFSMNIKDVSVYLPFILFVAIFLGGVLIGNLTVGSFDFIKAYTKDMFDSFYIIRKEGNWLNIFGDSAFGLLPYYVIVFLTGTSVIGCICSPLILLFLGLNYGFITGYLYFTYSLNGIIFNSLLLLPCAVITLLGITILCIEAFNFSRIISNVCIRSEKTTNVYLHFKSYCIKSSATLISAMLAVFLDSFLSYLFIGFFEF